MIHLDRDFSTPIAAQVSPRPNRQQDTHRLNSKSGCDDDRRRWQTPLPQPMDGHEYQNQGGIHQKNMQPP
jgi:hypothetical protein